MIGPDDNSLLNDYATRRSEQAFRALVERYLVLVYSTALRQLGDRALAEEVAQNVFVALARKPHAFRYGTTLSSWFYKTSLLQARQVIRGELRRKQREETAIELGRIANVESQSAPLIPMLDEAILSLRERDRLAVVLRYLEDKPLREVGQALGISEDAAQKRVAKALDGLTQFFHRRGFAVPAITAASAPIFTGAVNAVPAGLAMTVSEFAVSQAAAAPISAAALFLTKLMGITKTQTAVACVFVGVIPAAVSWNSLTSVRAESASLNQRLEQTKTEAQDAETALAALTARQREAEANLATLRNLSAARGPVPPTAVAEPRSYPWSETSDFVRLPKSLLARVTIPPGLRTPNVGTPAPLSDELRAILQITPDEESKLMSLLDETKGRYRRLEANHMEPSAQHVNYRLITPFAAPPGQRIGGRGFQVLMDTAVSPDPGREDPAEIVSFKLTPFPEERKTLWTEFDASLQSVLGRDRAKFFMEQADVAIHGLAGELSIPNQDNQSITYTYALKAAPDPAVYRAHAMTSVILGPDGLPRGGSSGGGGDLLDPSEDQFVPEAMKPILARWRSEIAVSKTQP